MVFVGRIQSRILRRLFRNGRVGVPILSDEFGMSPSILHRSCQQLVADGLLDRGDNWYELTDSGYQFLDERGVG
jgi:DNA-binding IclR family transcriptional regulator